MKSSGFGSLREMKSTSSPVVPSLLSSSVRLRARVQGRPTTGSPARLMITSNDEAAGQATRRP